MSLPSYDLLLDSVTLPSLSSLASDCPDLVETTKLGVSSTDRLIMFMQPSCTDSIALSRCLRDFGFQNDASSCRMLYVDVKDSGRLLTDHFQETSTFYPSFSSEAYASLCSGRTVMPKLYRMDVSGKITGTYYRHHGGGLETIYKRASE